MNPLIDVHHHATSTALVARQTAAGNPPWAGIPTWTPEIAIEAMDATGITSTVLSLPNDFGTLPAGDGVQAAREVNDELASIVGAHAGRFGAFATMPMTDADAAVAELQRATDELGLDGVCLLTSYDGVYLSDDRYRPLLAEMHRRQTVVFVHPIMVKEPVAGLSPALLEGTFDTTRFGTKLLADGVLDDYAGIRFILPHTGGMVPFVKWRIAMNSLQNGNPFVPVTREKIDRQASKLDALYYDTTLNMGPLQKLARADRILFGTDVPWAGEALIEIMRDDVFEEARERGTADLVAFENAQRLFPRFA
jgi:predicted TIM-barrel fold metal-dependent hydrolase